MPTRCPSDYPLGSSARYPKLPLPVQELESYPCDRRERHSDDGTQDEERDKREPIVLAPGLQMEIVGNQHVPGCRLIPCQILREASLLLLPLSTRLG